MSLFSNKDFDKLLTALQIQSAVLSKFSASIVKQSWKSADSKEKLVTLRKVLNLLEKCTGKIVISSMGRFGKVAELVSATFTAVGVDSMFIHSSEAVHGDDLLTIQDNDLLLVLSKSGNKKDIVSIASLCKAKGITVISICDSARSALGDESDITIELGESYVELDVGDVTPTSSIILMLQICNALATALYHFKHTQGEKVLEDRHPSSEFGTKNVNKVKDVMVKITPIEYSMPFEELASNLSDSSREILFVQKDNLIVGQISGKDISKALNSDSKTKLFTEITAADIMNKDVRTISEDSLTADAVEIMNLNKVTSLLVDTSAGTYVIDLHSL